MLLVAAVSMKAQDVDLKELEKKVNNLLEIANANPNDWKAQADVINALRKGNGDFYDVPLVAFCYERIQNYLTERYKEVPDSLIREGGSILLTRLMNDEDKDSPEKIDKVLFYIDEMRHFNKAGVKIDDNYLNMFDMMGTVYSMVQENYTKALAYTLDVRDRATKANLPGIENSDVYTALLFDGVLSKYLEMYSDKLLEITMDDKKYIILAMGEWNIEKPLSRWMENVDENDVVAFDEDGTVIDDLHGFELNYGFICNQEGIVPQKKEGANGQLISVTPERRQELLKAYRQYLKKAKKGKKDKK